MSEPSPGLSERKVSEKGLNVKKNRGKYSFFRYNALTLWLRKGRAAGRRPRKQWIMTMETKEITTKYEVLSHEELPAEDRSLVKRAMEATYRSYAPYSHFCVGAAIRLSNGETVEGANQENVAFPSGTCAERSACYYAHAQYPEARFEKIAVAARGTDGKFVPAPVAPCGACRQALLEYEMLAGKPVEVLLVGEKEVYRLPSVASLLPFAFVEF